MQTGRAAQIHANRPWAILCSSATTLSPSPPSARTSSPAPAPRLSIASWPTAWLKHVGSGSSFRSFMLRCQRALSSTVIIQRRLPLHQPCLASAHKACQIDLHFIRERVAIGDVHILHILTTSQFTDIFTNGLPTSVF
jgi:hypothetical protein